MTRTFPLVLPFGGLPAEPGTPAKPSLFRRFLRAMMDARARQAEREVAVYLQTHGLKFTDAAEREIERRLSSPPPFSAD
jgi:hypothetical protein